MPAQKHVLVTVLDWGLGHATRCVPVIRELLNQNCKVTLAGNGQSLKLLQQEFPSLEFQELPSYNVSYSDSMPFMFKIFLQLPKFLKAIRAEHNEIEKLVAQSKVDLVISDNRYGCWCRHVPSVLITHQVNIILPPVLSWLSFGLNYFNHQLIKRFMLCWVPDFESDRITGRLTIRGELNIRYIGMLSRFARNENISIDQDLIVAVVSGPEPQRQVLESMLESQMVNQTGQLVLVRGIPQGEERNHAKIKFINHLPANELSKLIQQANVIITRSGYSTIMDLVRLCKKNVIMIPTPGQTEQEYLAKTLEKKRIALSQSQSDFDLATALNKIKHYTGFEGIHPQTNLLPEAIRELLEMKRKQ
jgi:uncharacterized protein (TIGR00661 family)